MTVVKRQAQNQAGVSSEVEVLKALKSLFEHHKALDEKVRERLRVAMERVAGLENELSSSHQENTALREKASTEQAKVLHETMLNGSIEAESAAARCVELQEALEKAKQELHTQAQRLAELSQRYNVWVN